MILQSSRVLGRMLHPRSQFHEQRQSLDNLGRSMYVSEVMITGRDIIIVRSK